MRFLNLPIFLFFLLFSLSSNHVDAQKVLQLEKINSLKVKKYYIGDVLTFQLKGEGNTWFTEAIEDIYQEKGMVLFAHRAVDVEDITAIRSFRVRYQSKPFIKSLNVFGLSWGVLSLLSPLAGTPLTWAAAIVPAASFALGGIIRILFRHRTYKIGKKRRMRLLDMDRESFFRQGP